MLTKQEVRNVNNYRVLFITDHPRAMSGNWEGYVYEHIVVAEKYLNRRLLDEEVIHHLDGNRSNNRHENLLVITRGEHAKLHRWLEAGAPMLKSIGENGMNSVKPNVTEPTYCLCCGVTLQDKQEKYCSVPCSSIGARKAERPSKNQLIKDILSLSFLAIGRKYGVSDNAVRKWMKAYGITKATLSQASGTTKEGAETIGEVQPS